MSCCATGPCGRRDHVFSGPGLIRGERIPRSVRDQFKGHHYYCYLCYVMPLIFAQPAPPADGPRPTANPARDGDPKLAAERKRGLVRKSKRAGPSYVPPARRV